MKVYINPGHDTKYDSGAVNPNSGLRECDVARDIGKLLEHYLNVVGIETKSRQSDNLYYDSSYSDRTVPVVAEANSWGADLFISIHCNACASHTARGTEQEVYSYGGDSEKLAKCIQKQIVSSVGTVDRGVNERPNLIVLKRTNMPAVLVETAFVDNDKDAAILTNHIDDIARAMARGVTDFMNL